MPTWDEIASGVGCPFCGPRPAEDQYRSEIARLSVSTLYLEHDQRYRGYCVLIFDPRHVIGLEQLDRAEYNGVASDLRRAARAIHCVCAPDLMNYQSLGNTVAHLHWHLVPRYKTDVRWGQPIYWGWTSRDAYEAASVPLPQAERASLMSAIRERLASE